MSKTPPKTFRAVAKRLSFTPEQTKLHKWVAGLYRVQGPGTPFDLKVMMEECGLEYVNKNDYSRVMTFLAAMRNAFMDIMDIFFESQEFEKYKASNMDTEEIFAKLVDSAVSWGVYPVWNDPYDHQYKLFSCWDFITLMKRGARRAVSELNSKAQIVGGLTSALPELAPVERPQLERDGLLYELPGGIRCDKCKAIFNTQEEFAKHYVTHMGVAVEQDEVVETE